MTNDTIGPSRRRALLHFAPGELETALGIDAAIIDARVDLERDVVRLLVASHRVDYVHPGSCPPIVPLATLRPDAVSAKLGGHEIGEVLAELGTDGIRWARGLAERLLADYAVSDRTPSGAGLDPAVSDVLDPAGGGTLHVWITNAIEAGRTAGYAAGLAASGIAPGSPTPVPLTDADPQFNVTTRIDGKLIGIQAIPDPIVRHTIVIDRRDLTPGDQPIRVEVTISATLAGIRHVMRPIDLSPNDEHPTPPSGHDLMAIGEGTGLASPGVVTSRPDLDPEDHLAHVSPETVATWLDLIAYPDRPDLDRIRAWTHAVRREVVDYCAAVHLSASDNDDVDVPALPGVLAP